MAGALRYYRLQACRGRGSQARNTQVILRLADGLPRQALGNHLYSDVLPIWTAPSRRWATAAICPHLMALIQ